jgi:hypothetical protein
MTNKKLYSIALAPTNNTAFRLTSRGSGANAPQLMIKTLP